MQQTHYQEHPPPLRSLHKFFSLSFFSPDLTERDGAGRSCPPAGPRGREWVREGLAFQRRCKKVSGTESSCPAAAEAEAAAVPSIQVLTAAEQRGLPQTHQRAAFPHPFRCHAGTGSVRTGLAAARSWLGSARVSQRAFSSIFGCSWPVLLAQGGGTDGYMKAQSCFRSMGERRTHAGKESPGS